MTSSRFNSNSTYRDSESWCVDKLWADVSGFAATCKHLDSRSLSYRVIKRGFDILFSVVVIVLGIAPGILLSLAICLDTHSTPFYCQERIGQYGKSFRIIKFRTMVAGADDVECFLSPEEVEEWKREGKVDNDPRITALGRFLRKTSLDEIPQCINVLFGQLSVVGPRAVTKDELRNYGEDVAKVLSVPQGVTGRWQCGPRNSATFSNGTRQKEELAYVEGASLKTDALIIKRTVSVMLVEKTGR